MPTDSDDSGNLAPGDATDATRAALSAAVVDFDDDADFERAGRGLIAAHPTGRIGSEGNWVSDTSTHEFLRTDEPAPATVHPGLWRQGRLNATHGLFEVTDGVWQARGYDISNVTFMAAESGWLVVDPLTTEETAAACLALANDTLGERPVTAVIYTHSHVDHFGGVGGVTSAEAVESGDVPVVAPEGFMHEVVGENGLAGPIMVRRGMYQFGALLPPGPRGHVDNGLGQAIPIGTSGLIAPTDIITETGTEMVLDGIRVVFQNTPGAEAPAEMNFFFPDLRLLCMAENCTHNIHNLYPIRGARTRDALAWSKYIHEALEMWGDDTDTMFASHHWPRFGRTDVKEFLALQRDVYRWMHDQTLRLANQGYTPDEIADELELPGCFAAHSHTHGYYGTVSHNVRSVYNLYLGWYDGNPANLHPLPPVETGRRYVEMMGGADAVLDGARAAFDTGDYRWVVQLLKHLVFADPGNEAARRLSADAMEQLGYQAESGTWRNAYLTGAFELRNGSVNLGPAQPWHLGHAMTGEQVVDMLGVRFDPRRFRPEARLAWRFTDSGATGDVHVAAVSNHALHHEVVPDGATADADVTVALERQALLDVAAMPARYGSLVEDGSITVESGDPSLLEEFLGALDVFESAALVEP